MTPAEAKQKLVDGCRILDAHGHSDLTRGHLSVRVPGDPKRFYMKPHSMGFDEFMVEDVITCDLEGEKVEGERRRHSEVYIHSEIYKVRPDLTAILHTHPPHCVAVSATGRPIRVISQPSACFYKGVPSYTGTIELIRNKQQGAEVAQSLGPHKAMFLKNHGVVVCGAEIEEAVYLALMLENAATIQILAESTGHLAGEFPREQVETLYKQINNPEQQKVNFEYLKRRLKRAGKL